MNTNKSIKVKSFTTIFSYKNRLHVKIRNVEYYLPAKEAKIENDKLFISHICNEKFNIFPQLIAKKYIRKLKVPTPEIAVIKKSHTPTILPGFSETKVLTSVKNEVEKLKMKLPAPAPDFIKSHILNVTLPKVQFLPTPQKVKPAKKVEPITTIYKNGIQAFSGTAAKALKMAICFKKQHQKALNDWYDSNLAEYLRPKKPTLSLKFVSVQSR